MIYSKGTGLGLVRLYKEQCKIWTAFNFTDFPYLNLGFVKALLSVSNDSN